MKESKVLVVRDEEEDDKYFGFPQKPKTKP